MIRTRWFRLLTLSAALAGVGGCGVIKLPKLPVPVEPPTSEVTGVRITEQSASAAHYQVLVTVTNPNDFPLPITGANYTLAAPSDYTGDTAPQATLPAKGTITVSLPAVVKAPYSATYDVRGSLEILPPGELRKVWYDIGFPQPRVPFKSVGTADVVSATPAKPAKP